MGVRIQVFPELQKAKRNSSNFLDLVQTLRTALSGLKGWLGCQGKQGTMKRVTMKDVERVWPYGHRRDELFLGIAIGEERLSAEEE